MTTKKKADADVTVKEGRAPAITVMRYDQTGRRPRLVLTDDGTRMVESMASIGCTVEEIAAVFGVASNTFRAPHNRAIFEQAYKRGSDASKMRIRRAQYDIMESGNAAMAIFLGKNVLGQSDKAEIQVTERPPEDADIDELYVRMKKRRL